MFKIAKSGEENRALSYTLPNGEKFNGGETATLEINGKKLTTQAQAGQSSVTFEDAGKAIAESLKEDCVSIAKVTVETPSGGQSVSEMPVLLNEKPGENRVLMQATKDNSGSPVTQTLKPDMIDKATASEQIRAKHLELGGSAEGMADGQSIALVVGKGAFVTHAQGGRWSTDLTESQLKAALGTDSLDAKDIDGKTIAIQAFVPGKDGSLQAYSQSSLTVDVSQRIVADSFAGNGILTAAEAAQTQKFSGSAVHAEGLRVEIWQQNAQGKPAAKIGETTVGSDGTWSYDIAPSDLGQWLNSGAFGLCAKLIGNNGKAVDSAEVSVNPGVLSNFTANDKNVFGTDHDATFEQAARNYALIKEHDKIDVKGLRDFPNPEANEPWGKNPTKMPESLMTYAEMENMANGLSTINAFRRFNQSDSVTLSGNKEVVEASQIAANVFASESRIAHKIGDFKHYDPQAAVAAKSSVIGQSNNVNDVSSYIADDLNGSSSGGQTAADFTKIGHRVQLLAPRLYETAPGYAIGHHPDPHYVDNVYTAYNTFNSRPWEPSLTHSLEDYQKAASPLPGTLEWPAAGYVPYALVPNKTWSFQFGPAWPKQIKDYKLQGKGVRVFKNGQEIDVEFATMQENSYEVTGSFSATVCFMPHEKDRQFGIDPNNGIGRWRDHEKGIDRPNSQVEDGKLTTDDYTVVIETNHGVYAYTVKVFDENQLSKLGSATAGRSAVLSAQAQEALEPETQFMSNEETAHRATVNGKEMEFGAKLDLSDLSFAQQTLPSWHGGPGVDFSAHDLTGAVVDLGAGDDKARIEGTFASELRLGAGDDVVSLGAMRGGFIDGGEGVDTAVFEQAGNVVNLSRFAHFETIDLGRPASEGGLFNIIQLDAAGMQANGGAIELKGGAGNKVALREGKIESAKEVVNQNGETEIELQYDVNGAEYRISMSQDLYNGGAGIL